MKAHVELQTVQGEVGANAVGGSEADVLGHILAAHQRPALGDCNDKVGYADPQQGAQVAAAHGPVDKCLDHARQAQLQCQVGQNQRGKRGHACALRCQICAEKTAIRRG